VLSSFEHELPALIATHGYWIVALVVALESMGVPLPGETVLVSAAIYAGATGNLEIAGVVAAAATGATVGDNGGYWIGRRVGLPLLLRYGRYLRIGEDKIKLGRYMFARYGGSVVFLARFIALLRVLAAFLAGVNRMGWARFFAFNIAGGVAWASLFGFGAYTLGSQIERMTGGAGVLALAAAAGALACGLVYLRRQEARLLAEANRAYPGPLAP
jgi:membrane protein DedA with SNARE-associated domain